MKKYTFIAAYLTIILLFGIIIGFIMPSANVMALTTPDEVAHQSLPEWMHDLQGDYEEYGFNDESELDKAHLGIPFEVYELTPNAVQNYQSGQQVSSLIQPIQQWVYPVLVDNEARGLLTIAHFQGQWQAVEFAGIDSGEKFEELQQHITQNPGEVKIIRLFQTNSTLALVERNRQESIIMVSSYPDTFAELDQQVVTEHKPEVVITEAQEALSTIEEQNDTVSDQTQ